MFGRSKLKMNPIRAGRIYEIEGEEDISGEGNFNSLAILRSNSDFE